SSTAPRAVPRGTQPRARDDDISTDARWSAWPVAAVTWVAALYGCQCACSTAGYAPMGRSSPPGTGRAFPWGGQGVRVMWKRMAIESLTAPRWGQGGRRTRPWGTASHMTLCIRAPRGPFRTPGGRAPCKEGRWAGASDMGARSQLSGRHVEREEGYH